MAKIGELGEDLVACWLRTQGWIIKYRRWRCRWGEIDIIAQFQSGDRLAFVEVKTRGIDNWDLDGLLAITPQKQAKLSKTAAFFLAKYPAFDDFPCQFDVALVNYRSSDKFTKNSQYPIDFTSDCQHFELGKPIYWQGYQLILQQYIEAAFDLS